MIVKHFAIVEKDGGLVISTAFLPEGDEIEVLDSQALVEVDAATHLRIKTWTRRWKRDGEDFIYDAAAGTFATAKWGETPGAISKTTALANQADLVTISGLLNPTEVTIPGIGNYIVTDGLLNLTFDMTGTYAVYCVAARHTPKVFQIVVS